MKDFERDEELVKLRKALERIGDQISGLWWLALFMLFAFILIMATHK